MPLERVPRAVPQQAQDSLLLPLQSLQQSSLLLHIWFIGISVVRKYPWHKSYWRTNSQPRRQSYRHRSTHFATCMTWRALPKSLGLSLVFAKPTAILAFSIVSRETANEPSSVQSQIGIYLVFRLLAAKSPHPQALLPRTRDIQNYHCIHVRGILALGRILLGVECKTAVTVGEDSKVRKW